MTPTEIKTILDRNVKALELRPAIGQGTAVTRVRMREGLACEIEEGQWKLAADMSEKSGGTNTAPNPGVLGRASLGSCLAIGYMMHASMRGVPIQSLEVEIQADYDTRSEFGIDEVRPGYRQVRCIVRVESSASEEEVRQLIDDANSKSSYLHVWMDPQDVRIDLRVNGAA